jgi:hypothetical protein
MLAGSAGRITLKKSIFQTRAILANIPERFIVDKDTE